jgi:hypothetical protein
VKNVHAHESSSDHAERPRKAAVVRPVDRGLPAAALTPDSLLHLQRTAGNGAVASALAVQRKNMNISDGQITGMFSWLDDKSAPRQSAIAITDGYLKV